MNNNIRRLIWALLLFASSLAGRGATRFVTEKDLLKFQWVADPQISPDGREIAYVLVTVNEKEDRYDTSLWAVATSASSQPRRLTAGPRDLAPRWSPDSLTLAFLRAAGEKEKPQLYLLPMNGGEATKLTDLPRGASPAVWSPSGKVITFTNTTTEEDLAEKRAAQEKKEPIPRKSDVRVVTRAVYRRKRLGLARPHASGAHLDDLSRRHAG